MNATDLSCCSRWLVGAVKLTRGACMPFTDVAALRVRRFPSHRSIEENLLLCAREHDSEDTARPLQTRPPKMVRHKKDNFSSRGKKYSNAPRPRGPPREDGEENEGGERSVRPSFKAACWDLGHCDMKRCSGKRLMRLGMMRELHIGQKFAGVVIS